MINRRKLLKIIDNYRAELARLKETYLNDRQLAKFAQIEAQINQSKLLNEEDIDVLTCSEYEEVLQNRIPPSLQWLYWVFINQITYYWLGRYNDYELSPNSRLNVDQIELAKYTAIMYGRAAYHKKLNVALYVDKVEDDLYYCYPCGNFDWTNWNTGNLEQGQTRLIKNNFAYQMIKCHHDEIVLCSWRMNNIGNYFWYLQNALFFLILHQLVIANATNLKIINYWLANYDPQTRIEMIKKLTSIKTTNVIIRHQIKDQISQDDLLGKVPMEKINEWNSFTNDLLMSAKYAQEQFFNLFGIPISSAKQQSLSADASLTVTLSNNIATEHDRRIKQFHQALGLPFQVRESEMITQNQNADQGGQAVSHTDGQKVKEKV